MYKKRKGMLVKGFIIIFLSFYVHFKPKFKKIFTNLDFFYILETYMIISHIHNKQHEQEDLLYQD